MGLKNGELCLCDTIDLLDNLQLTEQCDLACKGNDQEICGGHDSISAYEVTTDREQ